MAARCSVTVIVPGIFDEPDKVYIVKFKDDADLMVARFFLPIMSVCLVSKY